MLTPMETISINTSSKPTRKTLNGKSYLVSQSTIIVPGVLPGSKGRLLYTPTEISRSTHKWNHVPLTLNHPTIEGENRSARSPEVLEQFGMGFIFNTEYNGKLKTELWFDEERTQLLSPKVYAKVKKGEKLELSTGLFTKDVKAEGSPNYNGKVYDYIATDYVPDHVAVLDSDIGACSILDGCGVNVNSSTETDMNPTTLWTKLGQMLGIGKEEPPVETIPELTKTVEPVVNELSFSEVHSALSNALRSSRSQADPYCYILDIYDDYFLFEMGGMVYSQKYKTTDVGVELSTKPPVQVVRQVQYVPTNNTETDMPLNAAQRQSIINTLVTNCDCWKHQGDKDLLVNFSDEKLLSLKNAMDRAKSTELVANMVQQKTGSMTFNTAEELEAAFRKAMNIEDKVKDTIIATTTTELHPVAPVIPLAQPVQAQTVEQFMGALPPIVQNALKNLLSGEEKERVSLVEKITANVSDPEQRKVAAAIYGGMGIDQLRQLSILTPSNPTSGDPILDRLRPEPVNFGGAVGPVINSGTQEEEPLVPLTIDWDSERRQRSNRKRA